MRIRHTRFYSSTTNKHLLTTKGKQQFQRGLAGMTLAKKIKNNEYRHIKIMHHLMLSSS